jgi:hypothetical protein
MEGGHDQRRQGFELCRGYVVWRELPEKGLKHPKKSDLAGGSFIPARPLVVPG